MRGRVRDRFRPLVSPHEQKPWHAGGMYSRARGAMAGVGEHDREVFDRVAYTLAEACEHFRIDWQLMRWRIYLEMTPRWYGTRHSRLAVRAAEIEPWYREAIRRGLAGAPRQDWPLWPIVEPVTEQPVYSFISCSLRQAAERTGISETTLTKAIDAGYLTAHRAGEKGGRILLRAADLDAWVQALPTESPVERDRRW